jgi:hypothetical protein
MKTIQETQHAGQSTPEQRGVYATQGMQGDEPMVAIVTHNDCCGDEPITTFHSPERARGLAADITAMSIEVDYQRAALRPEVMAAIERVRAALADQTDMTVVEVFDVAVSLGINPVDLIRYAEAAQGVHA